MLILAGTGLQGRIHAAPKPASHARFLGGRLDCEWRLWAEDAAWEQAKREFQASNPTLRAGQIGIGESRAQELTASLRPNPDLTVLADQLNPFTSNPYQPFANTLPLRSARYLHERGYKRELPRESARDGTSIAISQLADQERKLLFDLRCAFVQVLQQNAVLTLARENLEYHDRLLDVSRNRFKAGDFAQVDLDRLELQRLQFESDMQIALVNLRTAKIQLLALLNDRTLVEQLNVTGRFDFAETPNSLDEYRQTALGTRPDLRAAMQAVDKAKTDYRLAVANGSTDPIFGLNVARDPPIPISESLSPTSGARTRRFTRAWETR
jgi:outer membrane protein, heavy metal efflux system